jgi:hypothetical protein
MATGRVPTTANSPLTAKGDLFTYSTAPARLAVGSNGDTIVADSSTSTGLRYTAGTVQENPILNSSFQVWQRGTSFTPASSTKTYTADRWCSFRTATGLTVSRQATGDTTNLPFIQYCARVSRDSGTTSTATPYFIQAIETVNTIPFAGKTITVSFYARKGANFSAASDLLTLQSFTGTGTDQDPTSFAYTGQVQAINSNFTLTTTWQRFTVSATYGATVTEADLLFSYSPVGTAGANDYYEVTGVQLDIGSVALPFRTYAGTIQGELAACQRYYWRNSNGSAGNWYTPGVGYTTTEALGFAQMPVTMRVAPTIIDYSNLAFSDGSSRYTFSSLTINQSSASSVVLYGTGLTGLTAFRPYFLANNNNASGYFGLGAEL